MAAAVGRVDKDEASRRKTGGPFQSNGNGYGAQRRRRRIGEEGMSGVETPRSEREVANGRKTGHTVTKNLIKTAGAARLQGCMNQNQTLAHCIQNEPSSLVESSPAERGSPHTHQMHPDAHTDTHTYSEPTRGPDERSFNCMQPDCSIQLQYHHWFMCVSHTNHHQPAIVVESSDARQEQRSIRRKWTPGQARPTQIHEAEHWHWHCMSTTACPLHAQSICNHFCCWSDLI